MDKIQRIGHAYGYNIKNCLFCNIFFVPTTRGAGKSLARPGRIQAIATEDFEFHVSYL